MFLKVIFSKSKLVILLQAFLLLRGHNHQPIRGRFGVSPRLLGLRESVAKQTHTCNTTVRRKESVPIHTCSVLQDTSHTCRPAHTIRKKQQQQQQLPINMEVGSSRCVMPSQNDKLSKLQAGRGNALGLRARA